MYLSFHMQDQYKDRYFAAFLWSAYAKIGPLFLKLEARDRNHSEYGKGYAGWPKPQKFEASHNRISILQTGGLFLNVLKGLFHLFQHKISKHSKSENSVKCEYVLTANIKKIAFTAFFLLYRTELFRFFLNSVQWNREQWCVYVFKTKQFNYMFS